MTPVCAFCKRSGAGVQFNIFNPRFKPFGTACVACEESLPADAVPPVCPNCEQWQYPVRDAKLGTDCTNECKRRGFA